MKKKEILTGIRKSKYNVELTIQKLEHGGKSSLSPVNIDVLQAKN